MAKVCLNRDISFNSSQALACQCNPPVYSIFLVDTLATLVDVGKYSVQGFCPVKLFSIVLLTSPAVKSEQVKV